MTSPTSLIQIFVWTFSNDTWVTNSIFIKFRKYILTQFRWEIEAFQYDIIREYKHLFSLKIFNEYSHLLSLCRIYPLKFERHTDFFNLIQYDKLLILMGIFLYHFGLIWYINIWKHIYITFYHIKFSFLIHNIITVSHNLLYSYI